MSNFSFKIFNTGFVITLIYDILNLILFIFLFKTNFIEIQGFKFYYIYFLICKLF